MPELICPECRAEIAFDPDDPASSGKCPSCGADVDARDLAEAGPGDEAGPLEQMTEQGSAADEIVKPLPPPPAKSGIRIVESSDDRFVLFIPAGGKGATGIGCFALIWNGFMVVFTTGVLGSFMNANGQKEGAAVFLAVITLFWAIGLGFAWFWAKLRFERTLLLLDRERIVVQRMLFGRKRMAETVLDATSRAELVESYQQNGHPVYRIEVSGNGAAAKFGTGLSDDEKNWIVDRINEFLGLPTAAALEDDDRDDDDPDDESDEEDESEDEEDEDGDSDEEEADSALDPLIAASSGGRAILIERPDELPADDEFLAGECLVRIVESSPDRLLLFHRLSPSSPIRQIVPWIVFAVSGAILAFVGYQGRDFFAGPLGFNTVIAVLFDLPFLLGALAAAMFGLYLLVGRTTIDLTRESLSCRWSVGAIGKTWSLPVAALDSVRVSKAYEAGQGKNARENARVRGSDTRKPYVTCVARAGSRKLSLTFFNDEPLARQIALLMGHKLGELGLPVRHA